MKNLSMSLFAMALLTLICSGCNKGPDPKANPNFQKKSKQQKSGGIFATAFFIVLQTYSTPLKLPHKLIDHLFEPT
jgi:hypothetical protein